MSKTLQVGNGEKLFLVALAIVTILQIATWGKQTVKHLLGLILQTPLPNTTFLDPIIGIVAIVASALLLIGVVLRWRGIKNFGTYLILGTTLFIFKALFDIFNEIIFVKQHYTTVTESHIEELASNIGSDIFIIAIWGCLLAYFLRITKNTTRSTSSEK